MTTVYGAVNDVKNESNESLLKIVERNNNAEIKSILAAK